ncbi:MAG TPA: helix-turn-helix domain-containing protein, partial [Amycolatopsis sp.]|nr:helix-turn-helix domain-containing protein [Amycolatopsis sp.]
MQSQLNVDDESPLVTDSGTASVLKKVQLILSAFEGGKPQLGLTALARRAGLSKATTYRLAQELSELGFLDRVDGEYQL